MQLDHEQKLIKKMSSAIVEKLKQSEIKEPVYGVILTYSTQEGEELTPWIAVGTERERKSFAKQDPKNLDTLLWDGEVLEFYDPVETLTEDMDFMDACAVFSMEVHTGSHPEERITAFMQRVCFELQKQDWSKIFPLTEDFVVTACTIEGEWLEENMGVLLSDEQYDTFVQKGYLLPPCGCAQADGLEP